MKNNTFTYHNFVGTILLLLTVLCTYQPAAAQEENQGFIRVIGSDARSLALGESNSSDIADPSISVLNPATMSIINKNTISYGSYQSWTRNVFTQDISYRSRSFYGHAFLASFQYINTSLRGLDKINYLWEPELTPPELERMQLTLAYSYAFTPVFSMGILGRGYTAWTYYRATENANFDIGAVYAPTNMLSYSLIFRGIGYGLEYEILGNGATIIRNINLKKSLEYGATLYFPNQTDQRVVSISGSTERIFQNGGLYYRVGIEGRPFTGIELPGESILNVRGGYLHGPDEQGFSFGLGLKFASFALSYSVLPDSRALDRSHQLELLMNF